MRTLPFVRVVVRGVLVGACAASVFVFSADSSARAERPAVGAPAKPRAPIRGFDLPTLERLGRMIARHDYLAWIGTDVVVEHVGGREKLAAEGAVGWVIDTSGASPLVHFLRQPGGPDTLAIAHTVKFPAEAKPFVVPAGEYSIAPSLVAQHRAREAALQEFSRRGLPICNDAGPYNFATLPDPDGSGYLVYLLRPKRTMQTVPIGGHYRITVAADGETVEQIDALSASCISLDRSAVPAGGGEMVAMSCSHIVSATPVETHVFVSLQEKLPLQIITPDAHLWRVEAGRITLLNGEAPAAQPGGR